MKCPQYSVVVLLCLLMSATYASAQSSCVAHPVDPLAQYLGSFSVVYTYASSGFLESQDCQAHVEICTWLTTGGSVDYTIDAASIWFSGSCPDLGSITYAQIMANVSEQAVVKGTDLDYSDCGDTVSVWVSSCADRTGSGVLTTFDPCDSVWCERRYIVACPSAVEPNLQYEEDYVCSGVSLGCETGCDDDD